MDSGDGTRLIRKAFRYNHHTRLLSVRNTIIYEHTYENVSKKSRRTERKRMTEDERTERTTCKQTTTKNNSFQLSSFFIVFVLPLAQCIKIQIDLRECAPHLLTPPTTPSDANRAAPESLVKLLYQMNPQKLLGDSNNQAERSTDPKQKTSIKNWKSRALASTIRC